MKKKDASALEGTRTSLLFNKLTSSEVSLNQAATTQEAYASRPSPGSEIKLPREDDPVEQGFATYDPSEAYPPGSRILLPIDRIVENPRNPRVFMSDNGNQTLAHSLASMGQLTAVQVYPADSEGVFMLKSGHRRRVALLSLSRTHIKAEVVVRGETIEEYKQARALNIEHKTHTHIDDAVRFKEMLDSGEVKDNRRLSEYLGISESEISKLKSIAEIPQELLRVMAENIDNFGVSASYLIYQYWAKYGAELAAQLIEKVINKKMSVRQLDAWIKATEASSPRADKKRERALSRAEIRGCFTGEVKAFEGKLVMELVTSDEISRDSLFRKIIELLEQDANTRVDAAKT